MKKKLLLSLCSILSVSLAFSQSFNDDFESYTAGSKLGPQSPNWTTWSNADGGTEDVNVITTDAHSGTESIYFSSTSSTGGPADVVLPFGGVHNTGTFEFKAWFKVPAAKSAYFNFQANATIGQVWAMDCYMNADGTFEINNVSTNYITSTYPQGQWFELKVNINFNTNTWEVFVDSVSKGTFTNSVNQVASIDIYPANAQASYWVDDVSYVVTPYVLPSVNASLLSLNISNGLVGQQRKPSAVIRNLGTSAITSFDLALTYNGNTINKQVTGVNIASLSNYTYNFTEEITLASGTNNASIVVSNVNGAGADGDANDNERSVSLSPIVAAAGKVVVGEEATGTWCQWCPRGAVYMDYMDKNYHGYFAGIAVHNNDPMVYAAYDAAIGARVAGYPSALVDRAATEIDPSELEPSFTNSVINAPVVILKNGATYDANTRRLKVSISNTLTQDISGDYKVACVLTEDSVKGAGSGYNQANAYAGGAAGPMGGYELLANPVAASIMVYDHVARIITPSFDGYPNAFGASADSGTVNTYTYTFDLPASWKSNKINIIGMVVRPDGTIENGSFTSISDAEANGYVIGTEIGGNAVGIEKLSGPDAISLYPNPSTSMSNVRMMLNSSANVHLRIYNMSGQLVADRDYGMLDGSIELPINTSSFNAGLYLVNLSIDGESKNLKLMVK